MRRLERLGIWEQTYRPPRPTWRSYLYGGIGGFLFALYLERVRFWAWLFD